MKLVKINNLLKLLEKEFFIIYYNNFTQNAEDEFIGNYEFTPCSGISFELFNLDGIQSLTTITFFSLTELTCKNGQAPDISYEDSWGCSSCHSSWHFIIYFNYYNLVKLVLDYPRHNV